MLAPVSAEDRRKLVTRGRADPAWFIRTVLGRRQWSMQDQIAESVRDNKVTAVSSGNSGGKTFCAANVALWFLFNHQPSMVITTAPTGRQVPAVMWKEIGTAHERARYPLGGRLLNQELKIAKDWFAIGFTTDKSQPNSMAGFKSANVLVIVDESCGVVEAIHDGIDGILASGNARKLEIGNPLDRNTPFGRSFRLPSVRKFQLGAFDSPNFTTFGITVEDIRNGDWKRKIDGRPLPWPLLVTPEWAREKWEKWGEAHPSWHSRVLGRFPDSSPDAVFPGSFIRQAQALEIEPSEHAPKIMGVDVARSGEDETVFVLRHAGRARTIYRSVDSKPDTMATAGRVVHEAREHGVSKVLIDVVGIGAGVVDRLRELRPPGLQVEGVNFGAGAVDSETYLNVRAECYWNVRKQMEDLKLDIDPADLDLEADLSPIQWSTTSGGKIQIESKESMRKRGIRSPNIADALALAYADQTEGQWWVG